MQRNTRMWSVLVFLMSVAVTATSPARQPEPAEPENRSSVPTYTSERRLPQGVTLATLANGLTVIVQENHAAAVATVRCYIKNTGSAYEGRYLGAGLSHVLEHVVAGGSTKKRTEKQIEKIIDRFGGATNAFTSTHLTAYYIDCPAEDAMTAIDLLADSMQHVIFEPSEFAREMKVVRRELADGETNRRRVQWNLLKQTVYTLHPIRHPVIGYLDVLDGTTNETIIDFYRRRYVPNNQVFVVVGDVDTRQVLDAVARQWSATPRSRETLVALPREPEQLSPRETIREMDGNTYDVALAWPTVKLSHPDLYALDVAAYVLAEGESSRLVRRLKYDEQLVLSVSSASYTPHFANGYFAIFAHCTADHWRQACDEILAGTCRLRDELVSEAELAKAKKQKAAELVFGRQTVQKAADSLGRNYLSTGDPLFDDKYVENIQKVTAEQVRAAARRYLVPGRLNRMIIAPPGGVPKSTSKDLGGGESEIRALRLRNGLRVLVKRNTRLPMVNIQAFVLAGSLVDTVETAGRSALVGAMLDKGAARHSAEQIAHYFDSTGGKLSFAAGRFTVFGGATVLRDEFPSALAMFAECFTQPSFPESEFRKVQTLALGAIARRRNDPRAEIFELFHDSLPATTPYHVLRGGKAETVKQLSAKGLRAYHAKYFVPGNIIVTVFGDIEPDKAIALLNRHFGALKPDPDFEPIGFDRENAVAKTIVRHKQTGKDTGMILLGYPAVGIRDKKDFAALTVLDAILSGYSFPGGWLHNELRGEGLVYYVHAFLMSGPAPGYFTVLSQTRPDKINDVVERIKKNIARAKQSTITEDEFHTAVQMIIALHAQQNTTIAEQAQQAALDELYGLGHAYDKTFDARIRAVTLDDVVRVARKHLNNHVLVSMSPAKR